MGDNNVEKQVILSLGSGSLQEGFPKVKALLRDSPFAAPHQFKGALPRAPQLQSVYCRWWLLYDSLLKWKFRQGSRIQFTETESVEQVSIPEFIELSKKLVDLLNDWLSQPEFNPIYTSLTSYLSVKDEVFFILDIDENDEPLTRLPWQEWNFFELYERAIPAFSLPQFRPSQQQRVLQRSEVRVLAVLGDSQGIDIQPDRQQWEQLHGSQVTFLEEPSREVFFNALYDEQGWDILFFAGHSHTESGQGYLHLSSTQQLTLQELKAGLKRSMQRGLHLAIFNSCDGIGLAQQLAHLEVPNIIVMRDVVPDVIAQTFLQHFLSHFSSGASIAQALRESQDRLEGMADHLPRAGWLPILYRNPAVPALSWQELQTPPILNPTMERVILRSPRWSVALMSSLMALGLVIGLRAQGGLQSVELKAFDWLMQRRPAEPADDRFLMITIDEADIRFQKNNLPPSSNDGGSLSDEALTQLLKKLAPHDPSVIGLDIYHDAPFPTPLAPYFRGEPALIASCRIDEEASEAVNSTISAPENIPNEHLGFTDWPRDPDGRIRRQFLGMASIQGCPTSQSLSLRVTLAYLEKMKGLFLEKTESGERLLDQLLLKKLTYNSGNYQLPSNDTKGYQILINYRATPPPQVALKDILNGSRDDQLAELVKGRIILIGRGGLDDNVDHHFTPYSRQAYPDQPGVFIHAQMSSQILSAVLDERPLLWWWPQWLETLWIAAWVMGGTFWLVYGHSHRKGLAFVVILVGMSCSCYFIFLQGGWIPLIPPLLASLLSGMGVFGYQRLVIPVRERSKRSTALLDTL